MKIQHAKIGTVIHGTHLASDLIPAFTDTLEGLIVLNGHFLALPENRDMRDRVNNAMGEGQDWAEGIADGDVLLNETLPDALSEFAPPYCYFGTSEGDGSDFGFWPNMEAINDLPHEGTYDPNDEDREHSDYKVVNCHGNVTVYNCYGAVLLELV
jgi:hypothetical protein